MTFPQFYNPNRVGQLYIPNTTEAVEAGRTAGFSPAEKDDVKKVLLLVDTQVDFIHTDGALSVPGAIADTRRTIEWLIRHIDTITTIAASLDSHIPIQIFSPTWWINREGQHPLPYTPITSADVKAGRWQPLYEPAWSVRYTDQLESQAKKELMIWPYHTLIGTPGHNITPALYEAIAYHSAARQAKPIFLSKGSIPETEHYSIVEPEVKVPGRPESTLNTDFLNMLAEHDVIYIAGQAKSHCVLETVASIMRYFANQLDIINRIRILMDCTSSVVHPEIDFDALANETLATFETQGLHLVYSDEVL